MLFFPTPPNLRPPALRAGLAALIMGAVVWPATGAARPGAVPAPVPAPVPPLAVSLGDGLATRYAAARAEILAGLDVTGVVLLGGPGAGVATAAALGPHAGVWAGRAAGDWVALLPHVSVELPFGTVGLAADPVAPGFGARVLGAGGGGHGDYLAAGSTALASVARIVAGAGDGRG
ncbi:alpha/beta hydrolase [Nonomuraea wenchangensis]|uniref:alpha/beta hydrolase n=1 Tax=Nonomuraea wenchangensis TaxID=568860 RepID=UPI00341A545B